MITTDVKKGWKYSTTCMREAQLLQLFWYLTLFFLGVYVTWSIIPVHCASRLRDPKRLLSHTRRKHGSLSFFFRTMLDYPGKFDVIEISLDVDGSTMEHIVTFGFRKSIPHCH